jgi:translocation and assembly module TamA
MPVGSRALVAGLCCVLLLPAAAAGQEVAPVVQPPDPRILDPRSLDAMPDIGVDWPDLGAVDTPPPPLVAQPDDPVEPAEEPAPQMADEAATPDADQLATGDVTEAKRYDVELRGLDGIADDAFTLRFDGLSALVAGRKKTANLAQIDRRLDEDRELLDRLLRAKGYYAARIRGRILAPLAGADRIRARLNAAPGVQYLLSSVDLEGLADTGPNEPKLRDAFTVKVGDPVDADNILAASQSLATALLEQGFPFSKVGEPDVRIDHETRKGDLDIVITSGGYRRFGAIRLNDDRLFDAAHVQSIARFDPGDRFKASDVEDLRRALVATGLVSSVSLTPTDAGDGEHVDLAVDLRPAPLRTIAGELGYGTGEGYRAEVSWTHRNLFPPEGSLTLRGVLGTQEQSGSVTFRRNNFRERDHVLTALISASDIQRDAYDARTLLLSASLERQTNILFRKKWVWRVGAELAASDEADAFSAGGRRTFLIGAVPLSLTYDGSNDLLDPTRGFRLGGRFSPELSFQNSVFGYARVQLDGSLYVPASDHVVIASRARFGTILGSSVDRIAPTRRFYAGGGGSVRGYGYQAIGPRDSDNDPIGGKSLAEFSLEARVRFGNFGIVPFVDAGNISTSFLPRFRDLRIGAGVGVRYHSSFGPIRVDLGTPLNPQSGDPRVAVYVSLGQAF